jgi:hypothetical protein
MRLHDGSSGHCRQWRRRRPAGRTDEKQKALVKYSDCVSDRERGGDGYAQGFTEREAFSWVISSIHAAPQQATIRLDGGGVSYAHYPSTQVNIHVVTIRRAIISVAPLNVQSSRERPQKNRICALLKLRRPVCKPHWNASNSALLPSRPPRQWHSYSLP